MRILIIEDNAEIRNLLKVGLEAESFAVDTAEDGEKGSFIARTNDYDLVLLDYMLPKKNGDQVCKEIRKAGKKTPILLLSVQNEVSDKVTLLQNGADDYMTKPFSFEELVARIRTLMRRPQILQEETFEIGNVKLNSRTQEVKMGKENVYLTKKEYTLLEFLLRHKGETVSRGMIMEHVWDLDGDPFSNTIETHIFNLRKKIEQKKNGRLIFNVPGRGYKITTAA
jgi:DNA-binding response OmpR family regulator